MYIPIIVNQNIFKGMFTLSNELVFLKFNIVDQFPSQKGRVALKYRSVNAQRVERAGARVPFYEPEPASRAVFALSFEFWSSHINRLLETRNDISIKYILPT